LAEIVAYGAYVPCWRISRAAIAEALFTAGASGTRAVAAYDEDSTTMGVAAGRVALANAPTGFVPDSLIFATSSPAYLDKTNATAIHAALGLPEATGAYDVCGAIRSAAGAMRLANSAVHSSLVVCADVRTGLPGSADESAGGDAAVAFAFGIDEPPLATTLGRASASAEFLDRWRVPGAAHSRIWEERFGESAYLSLGRQALNQALATAGLSEATIDHLVIAGPHDRAVRSLGRMSGVVQSVLKDDLTAATGNTGAAHAGLLLATVLDRAKPGETIVVIQLADGADVTVMRATDALDNYRTQTDRCGSAIGSSVRDLSYTQFLGWRGMLQREPPRRPDPDVPAAPPSYRNVAWKFGLSAGRCECGTRHMPPARVCHACGARDRMTPERMADVRGKIASYTIDRLAYSPSPPVVIAVIDFDEGGRFRSEMADVDLDRITVGARVDMSFRRFYTATNGVHDYFWKSKLAEEVN
jgi:3-hydroxy-3-methylglutaryl CoA synthase/uncharacterized OB-fold protein